MSAGLQQPTQQPSSPWRLGIDVGGTKIFAVVLNAEGVIVSRAKRRTKPEVGYEGVLQRIRKVADEALAAADLSLERDISCIGIGLPGPVLPAEGIIQGAVNLGWPRKPVAHDLSLVCGRLPMVIGNDVNFGALGEARHGAGVGAACCAALFMGTGLGAAVVLDGAVRSGAHGFAGELGHLPGPFDNARCTCGQRGCLETVASKRGIARMLREGIKDGKACALSTDAIADLRSSALRKAWHKECPLTREVLARACAGLAWGIAAVGLAYDPDTIVLGGGVFEELGQELQPLVEESLGPYTFYKANVHPRVRLAQLGDDAVAMGAAVASGDQR